MRVLLRSPAAEQPASVVAFALLKFGKITTFTLLWIVIKLMYIPLTPHPRRGNKRRLSYSSETPKFYQSDLAMGNTNKIIAFNLLRQLTDFHPKRCQVKRFITS
jgi:hypothetical protein